MSIFKKTAVFIPTYNGIKTLNNLFHSLEKQTNRPQIFVVDSSSTDGTEKVLKNWVSDIITIPSCDFNHGGTRQHIIDKHKEFDIYIFMTQDSYLEGPDALEKLLLPFTDESVGAVCGRQLPHYDASLLAQHARIFNYPPESSVKSIADADELGLKTAFMSNSFAAYRASALKDVGGFPEHVIFAEDMYAAAKMLLNGWKIAYAGDACCRHSHNYSIKEEFSRYFDMGVFHAREPWIREKLGGAGGEGVRYVISELSFLGIKNINLWPESLCRNFVKLFAYKLGQKEKFLPKAIKKRLGMYKRYWDGPFAN